MWVSEWVCVTEWESVTECKCVCGSAWVCEFKFINGDRESECEWVSRKPLGNMFLHQFCDQDVLIKSGEMFF